MLFLILCSFVVYTTGHLVIFCALCPRFSVCFSILITSLGEEGADLCDSRTFVCFARVCFCPFSLPLGVEGWLRFVIVAYPGPITFFLHADQVTCMFIYHSRTLE